MQKLLRYIVAAICLFTAYQLKSQKSKEDFNPKKEITYDGKRYRVYNNYVTFGLGRAYNSYTQNLQFNTAVDFNFHIKAVYFQSGVFLGGRYITGGYDHLNAHLCVGKRFEQNKFNLAGYLGACYSLINRVLVDTSGDFYEKTYNPLGFYACVQTSFKYKYDLGIGLGLFGEINKEQSVYGIRLELFFSGAYQGDRRKKDKIVPEEN